MSPFNLEQIEAKYLILNLLAVHLEEYLDLVNLLLSTNRDEWKFNEIVQF